MADIKRNSRDDKRENCNKKNKKQKHSKTLTEKNKNGDHNNNKKRSGPRLPPALRKELDCMNTMSSLNSDGEIDSDEGEVFARDVYEYEEALPEEESKKNRRFDQVENYEYELPEQFEDEDVLSDDDDDENEKGRGHEENEIEDAYDDQAGKEGDERHLRMLQGITGIPSEAFEGKKKNNVVISEAYSESEYNPSRDVLDGEGHISIEDLLDPLHGKSGYSKLRKRMHQMEKKSSTIHAPLPKVDQERLERKVAYEQSKKEISKWEPIVKRNREAPTMFFGEDVDLGFSTVGAIASEFEPRTEIEKKIASLVYDAEIMEAHRKDGSRLLELNKVSFEDEKDRQNRIAKMRSLLFRHEMRAKHIKNIKSKTYRRLLKKDVAKAADAQIQMNPEAAKELAIKQEFKRAEERMTLKHKNSSKWAKRILSRGLNAQDEGTRAAIAEQLHQHTILTRKMNSLKDGSSSSSDESSEEDDVDDSVAPDQNRASKLLEKAKEKTLKALDEEDEAPNSGVLSLPFMVRGMKKRKEAAAEEAQLALQEFVSMSRELVDSNGMENLNTGTTSGRRVFGLAKKQAPGPGNKINSDNYYGNSDSEDDYEAKESIDVGNNKHSNSIKDENINSVMFNEGSNVNQDSIFQSFDETVKDPGPKTTYEVAIFASETWKKIKNGKEVDPAIKKSTSVVQSVLQRQDPKNTLQEVSEDSDTDDEDQMIEGVPTSVAKESYKLPSQAELIHDAFAGDDVEEEFERDKQRILNEENPEPEEPLLLPGWGQWTHVQQKKGIPSWMQKEHEDATRKRQEAIKKRKDANLKHVIISEKLDKKAEKLHTKMLPYPFTSKEVFEQSIRMPIGPEFNPATAIGALNRPEVVKKSGVIIKPIEFEEVNSHEKVEELKSSGRKHKTKNGKSSSGGKTAKNMKGRRSGVK